MQSNIQLGDIAKDSISGFEGVVVGITEWLYGCATITIQPKALHEGKPLESKSFDELQLELVKAKNVPEPAKARTGGPRPEPQRGHGI